MASYYYYIVTQVPQEKPWQEGIDKTELECKLFTMHHVMIF